MRMDGSYPPALRHTGRAISWAAKGLVKAGLPRSRVRYGRRRMARHDAMAPFDEGSFRLIWFPLLLAAHVILAVSLLAPSLVLPFLLRGRPASGEPSPLIRLLAGLQGTGSVVIAIGLALTGAGLVLGLGTEILTRPWLLVALAVYAANLLVAAFVSRPSLRRLMRVREPESEGWRQQARRVRYMAYAMAVATGLIGFLMSTKPALW
jgi:hypothetical protein